MTKIIHLLLLGAVASLPLTASPAQQAAVSTPHQRLLPLQGGQNFRDLGGYRTTNGRSVRWGMLYRSGSMHFLTPADYNYLEKLGIRTVCDFRDTRERTVEPAVWPAGKAPHVLADDYKMDTGGIGLNGPGQTPTPEQARATMTALYPRLLTQFNSQYRRMFAELLSGHAPLAFNCTAGKDRTGVAAALLLTALGVPRKTVIQDYLLTNRYFDPNKVVRSDDQASEQWKRLPPGVLHAYMAADRPYIEAVLATMDAHRDGVGGYLRDELGLSQVAVAKLRRMYTQ
ncbi:tyrosine-protein phosphatase [Sphingomonas sp.]|uniref:tyrosine-protein phosphatase n=1 Tax=Sphingomonas sp. TaxID=28214 RepID=UPI003AFF973A